MARPRKSLTERFWSSVPTVATDSGCLEWTGARAADGYGVISSGGGNGKYGGRQLKAHRVAWELRHGPIADGLAVCHRCDNPPCVNPAHLFVGTVVDNNRDMYAKGRNNNPRGSASWISKLTEADVRRMREMHAAGLMNVTQLAKAFGVDHAVAWRAIHRENWRHVA